MAGTITIELENGRRLEFDEIAVLERENGRWLRCIRVKPSSREHLPVTTKYYHLESEVERIFR